ncbi:MAG: hypothetical protein HRU20_14545 [Pseudomonadales bacterium]|nr:hypothetical protein [Pseudomonadales bacterium]
MKYKLIIGTLASSAIFSGCIKAKVEVEDNITEKPDMTYTVIEKADHLADGTIDDTNTKVFDQYGGTISNSTWTSTTSALDTNGNVIAITEIREVGKDLYDTLVWGIDKGTPKTYTMDRGSDGSIDEIASLTYNSLGQLTSSQEDVNNDGNNENITTFNADGKPLILKEDTDSNGTVDSITSYHYDGNGHLLTEETDTDNNGSIDKIDRMAYTFDANNNVLIQTTDNGDDSVLDEIIHYAYDSKGNVLKESMDNDADNDFDWIISYSYDANGNVLTKSFDWGGDNVTDSVDTYTYVDGRLASMSEDQNADGTVEVIYTYSYQGNMKVYDLLQNSPFMMFF